MKHMCVAIATTAMMIAVPLAAQTIVNGSGTPFTAAGSGTDDPSCSSSFDTWCARNVRNNSSVGQTTARPRNGNGSLAFSSPNNSGKADFEYYLSSTFKLGTLQSLSYDYFRDASSTVPGQLAPALRILISQGGFSGALVFEPVYNGQPTATTGNWVTEPIGATTNVWLSQFSCGIQEKYDITLGTWQSATGSPAQCGNFNFNADANVIGFSTGVGSGWDGVFNGAVDNISYKTSAMAQARVFNFEVAGQSVVPEPSTYALMTAGIALVGIAARRRKNRA